MIIEVNSDIFKKFFPVNPHAFISGPFVELNKKKTERVVRLVNAGERSALGLIAGINDGILKSPFSAPFGGFHFKNAIVYISEIDSFVADLKAYVLSQGLRGIELILPPDIYSQTFNAKAINSLFRNGFQPLIPDITCWVNLQQFNGAFTQKNSKEYYRQAVRNELVFDLASNEGDMYRIYQIICQNRARLNRPIFMSFQDILNTSKLWPVDFFKVSTKKGDIVASAIFYRNHPSICFAVFWGDSEDGRPLRAMDFLAFNLWTYYKGMGFNYMDFGTSTEAGNPNEGLLRFKESHEAISSIRYKFIWRMEPNRN
jgi:hypothetical protein